MKIRYCKRITYQPKLIFSIIIHFLLILKVFLLAQEINENEITNWLSEIRNKGLALSDQKILELFDSPNRYKDERIYISNNYDKILNEIMKKKRDLQERYSNASQDSQKILLGISEKYLIASIEKLLIPLWIGIKWDFYGVPGQKPDFKGSVACGHFVQKILEDVGFNVKKNGETWLAYLPASLIIKSLTGTRPKNFQSYNRLLEYLKNEGPGIFLLGVDSIGWGSILFARYYGDDDLILMHSGPHFNGASVNYENGKLYLTEYTIWKNFCISKFDYKVVEKWLVNSPIIPCAKYKKYLRKY